MNRITYMNVLRASLLSILPITFAYSAEPKSIQKLAIEKTTAEPTHLTTRIQWIKYPHIQYKTEDLANYDRSAIVRVEADDLGNIVKTNIQESTGLKYLDRKITTAIQAAKVKPYLKDGMAIPVIGYQTFTLKLDQSEDKTLTQNQCQYSFSSKNWMNQQRNKSVPFEYSQQPQLNITDDLLKNKDRVIKFKFKVNKQGNVIHFKFKKRSGVNAIDLMVLEAVSNAKVKTSRNYKTLWIYKKSTLNDEIQFKLNECR